jgi:hypothetical protein
MTRTHRADLSDWTALRRVSDGGTAKVGDHWLDADRQVSGYVAGRSC